MPELGADVLVALLTLTAMEIVLGVDNVVFISILTGRLPADEAKTARRIGLGLALAMRIGLLLAISWVMSLTQPLFTLIRPFSGRDLILLGGGLVLIGKATWEIYDKLEVVHEEKAAPSRGAFALVIGQILVMDIVFSLDSVITAVGMANEIWVMVTAMVIAVAVMLVSAEAISRFVEAHPSVKILVMDIVFSLDSVITAVGMANEIWVMVTAMVIAVAVMLVSAEAISRFVEAHPSVKILALSFLLLIGVMLVAEGTGQHVGKGYIYAAMAFSLLVEVLNLRYRQKRAPVALHGRFEAERQEVRSA